MSRAKILVLDPEMNWTLPISEALLTDFDVFSANSLPDAHLLLQAHTIDLIVADVNLPKIDPMSLIEQFRQIYPQTDIIIHTGTPSISQAVQATKLGVVDYIEKSSDPSKIESLRAKISRAIQEHCTLREATAHDARQRGLLAASPQGFFGIISQDERMKDIFELIQTIADSSANVLIHGETGTGKELVARAVHEVSARHGKPFVTLDCSTLARELLESELFGHEKGAFTGATERHIGRFERADGGTLFIDEVANMDVAIQAKLLRVLQTRTFDRVGGQKAISVNVRIIAATNRSLEKCVAEGTFREDLYHRLNVVQIDLPALRERVIDIPLLAMEFLKRFAHQNGKSVRGFTDGAVEALERYSWPGNVRELENVVLQAVVLAKSPIIDVSDLARRIAENPQTPHQSSVALNTQLGQPEKQILIKTLRQHAGNIKRAAAALEISRTTLYAKLRKYEIDPGEIR
jgi:two-component system, NtrC family, response regulator AtoC